MADQILPDSTKVSYQVTAYRRTASAADQWDTGQWDIMQWDGGTVPVGVNIGADFIRGFNTRRGKDSFAKWFRVGTMGLDLSNTDGIWSQPDAPMQPGDYLSLTMSATLQGIQPTSTPIPDLTTWDDSTGREWTSHGSLILEDDGTEPQFAFGDVFYGKVNTGTDSVVGGDDVTRVRAQDQLAEFSVADNRAVTTPEGAGELSSQRMERIITQFGYPPNIETGFGEANPQYTMAATTFQGPMLQQLQQTMAAEGGAVFMEGRFASTGDGIVRIAYRDWLTVNTRSTVVQATFGGMGIPIIDAKIDRDLAVVVNESVWQNETDPTPSVATDVDSINRFGLRTSTTTGLPGDTAAASVFLANRQVVTSKDVRPFVKQVSIIVQDFASARVAIETLFGDLVIVFVESSKGWSTAQAAHVIGIDHEYVGKRWKVTFKLDDRGAQDVTVGGFDNTQFNEAFDLGEV